MPSLNNKQPFSSMSVQESQDLLEIKLLELEVGQALGLLVLLRFTHYCAST